MDEKFQLIHSPLEKRRSEHAQQQNLDVKVIGFDLQVKNWRVAIDLASNFGDGFWRWFVDLFGRRNFFGDEFERGKFEEYWGL